MSCTGRYFRGDTSELLTIRQFRRNARPSLYQYPVILTLSVAKGRICGCFYELHSGDTSELATNRQQFGTCGPGSVKWLPIPPVDKIEDIDEESLSHVEAAHIQASAKYFLQKQKRRALIATGAFVASCALVAPFLAGNPLHRYWDAIGKYILLLSMGLLIPFVVCVGWAWSAWVYVRDLRKLDEKTH
jgi:hypothetical protein